MRIVKHLINLMLPLAVLFASIVPSRSIPTIGAYAADDGKRTVNLNIIDNVVGETITYKDTSSTVRSPISDYKFSPERLFRNVLAYGETFLGVDDEYLPQNVNKDYFHIDTTNVNLYCKLGSSMRFGISYSNEFISTLIYVATYSQREFQVPALYINGEVMAYFMVTSVSLKLTYYSEYLTSVTQASYYRDVRNQYGAQYVLLFNFVKDAFAVEGTTDSKKSYFQRVSEIATPDYSSFYRSESEIPDLGYGVPYNAEKRFEYQEGFIRGVDHNPLELWLNDDDIDKGVASFLPYEVTYFDYAKGEIGLGHSVYGDKYGDAYSQAYLASFTFTIKSQQGEVQCKSEIFDEDAYDALHSGSSESEKKRIVGSKFYYGSRTASENENATGQVWGYQMPYPPVLPQSDALITITELEFYYYTSAAGSYGSKDFLLAMVKEDINEAYCYKFSLAAHSCEYRYNYNPCTGIAYQKVEYINLNGATPIDFTVPWWYVPAAILCPLALPWLSWLPYQVNHDLNNGLNIQHLYFQATDGDQVIDNITEISFRYETGHQKIKYLKDDMGFDTDEPTYYNKSKVELKTTKFEGGKTFTTYDLNSTDFELTIQQNGFFAHEDGNEFVSMVDGTKYKYFYQNVYETDGDTAYSNFINYWTPMTITYVMSSGSTKRLTTALDGTYMATDENGVPYVTSIYNPGVKIAEGETAVNEWAADVKTGTEYGETDDGEKNDYGKADDAINEAVNGLKEWWENLFQKTANETLTWVVIAGCVALGLVVIVIIVKIIGSTSSRPRQPSQRRSGYGRSRSYSRRRRR